MDMRAIPLELPPPRDTFAPMTTQQTQQTLALLADFDDPDLSELDLARRHGLSLDELHATVNTPSFQHALSRLRDIRAVRQPLLRARAEARAAEVLTNLTSRDPTTATGAKEIRLALKDLLRLLGAGGFQPPTRAQPEPLGGAGFQPATWAQPEPSTPTPPSPSRPKAGAAKPSARPRFKPRPKPVSR
jgi:hypothetical protein